VVVGQVVATVASRWACRLLSTPSGSRTTRTRTCAP